MGKEETEQLLGDFDKQLRKHFDETNLHTAKLLEAIATQAERVAELEEGAKRALVEHIFELGQKQEQVAELSEALALEIPKLALEQVTERAETAEATNAKLREACEDIKQRLTTLHDFCDDTGKPLEFKPDAGEVHVRIHGMMTQLLAALTEAIEKK